MVKILLTCEDLQMVLVHKYQITCPTSSGMGLLISLSASFYKLVSM